MAGPATARLVRTPAGVRYDGAGRYPARVVFTTDRASIAAALRSDPGHVRVVYVYTFVARR